MIDIENFQWTDYNIKLLGTIYQNNKISLRRISEIIGKDRWTLSEKLRNNGYSTKPPHIANKIHTENDNYFEKIDNEHKAYWLGLMYADGYVHSSKYIVSISLLDSDRKLLEKFRADVEYNGELSTPTKYVGERLDYFAKLSINSKKMREDLIDKGCVPQKSLILNFPTEEQVPKHLQTHFIRGYFDGDGSIWFDKGTKSYKIQLLSTKEFLSAIPEVLGINLTKLRQTKPDKNNYRLQYSGNNKVLYIMDKLYENATIYLDRKYERYLNLKNKDYLMF